MKAENLFRRTNRKADEPPKSLRDMVNPIQLLDTEKVEAALEEYINSNKCAPKEEEKE